MVAAVLYRTSEEVAAACQEALALAPPDLLPPLPPNKELLGAPNWYPFEIGAWPIGETIRQSFKARSQLKRDDQAKEAVMAVIESRNLRRGRQSFVMALGFRAAVSLSARMARLLADPDIDGQVVDTLLKMKAPGFVDSVKPLLEARQTWIRNLAKKYVSRYSEAAQQVLPADSLALAAEAQTLARLPVKSQPILFVAVASVLVAAGCGYSHIADFGEPTLVTRMELHDGQNELLWRIDSAQPTPLRAVDYRVIPPGFLQIFPSAGRPRHLREGEPLLVVYTTAASWTRHEGVAVDNSAFKSGVWLSGPLDRTSPTQVFVAARMPIRELIK